MPSKRRTFLKGLGLAGTLGIAQTVSASQADGRFIVDAGDSITKSDRTRIAGTDLDVVHDLEHVGYFVVEGDESDVSAVGYDYNPDVRLERNIDLSVDDGDLDADASAGSSPEPSVVDDVDISDQISTFPDEYGWDIASLNLPDAHDINRGTKPSGDPVRIGVIDDGVYDHTDLNVDAAASVDLTGDGEDVLHPNEQHYHGTHVAGISAANGGSGADRGRDGVAPEAEVVSMRYFSTAGAFFGDFAAAVEAAIVTDCDVINASLGFRFDLPENRTYLLEYIQDYIEELANVADSNGIVWVASAGNSANNADNLVPGSAKADDVLSVGATGPTGIVQPSVLQPATTPSYYTTHGEDYVDVSAPGGSWDPYGEFAFTDSNIRQYIAPDGVLSTYPPDTVSSSLSSDNPLPAYVIPDTSGGSAYGFLQGTSMAAPQVTGVAALLAAENPDWTPHEIRQVIKATARDIAPETYHGHGYVDPVAALQVSDPADVRGDLRDPGSDNRDDDGRNEYNGGSPRNAGGGSGGSSTRGDSRGDDDSASGESR